MKIAPIKDRKIIAAAAGISLLFLIFFVFVFIPKQRSIGVLKSHLKSVEEQIGLTEAMLGNLERLGPVLASMQQELTSFENKLLDKKQISSAISEVSSRAKSYGVEVIEIKPEKPQPLLDEKKQPIYIDKLCLECIKFSLQLRASYKAIAEYIKRIQDSDKVLASIEEVDISKPNASDPELSVRLIINVYATDKG
jgi:Tfp pilus assembly protein PilO